MWEVVAKDVRDCGRAWEEGAGVGKASGRGKGVSCHPDVLTNLHGLSIAEMGGDGKICRRRGVGAES